MAVHNIFAEMLDRVRRANDALDRGRRVCRAGIDLSRVTVEPPRDPATATWRPTPPWCSPRTPARSRANLPRRIAEKLRADDLVAKVDIAGPGFINLTLKPAAWIEALRSAVRLRRALRQERHRPRRAGQCRIRLGQSDRADACRPLPRRGVRRRAGQSAGLHRL